MGTTLSLERVEGYAYVGGREVTIKKENMTMGSTQLLRIVDQMCHILLLL